MDWQVIERLGGWGVMAAVFITGLRWVMRRADRALEQVQVALDAFRDSTTQFREFEKEEHIVHDVILKELKEIKLAVRDLQENSKGS